MGDRFADFIYCLYAPKELWEAYSNRTVRPSVPFRVRCISPIFFEVGIPNLVSGCILGWQSVLYHFRVAVTLTSDLVFIVSTMSVCPSVPLRVRCISPIFFEVGIPNLMCGCILGWRSVAYHFRVTVALTLTSDLVFRIIVSGAYLLYYLVCGCILRSGCVAYHNWVTVTLNLTSDLVSRNCIESGAYSYIF